MRSFLDIVKAAWLRNGRGALALSALIVLPIWMYLRNHKAVSEVTLTELLPFSKELSAEASDSPAGLKQARDNHVAMLLLYIQSLDRHDILSLVNFGRPAELRSKLIAIQEELANVKSEPDHAAAIRKAAAQTRALYDEYQTTPLGLPTLNRQKGGAVLVAVNVFCTTAHLFENKMALNAVESSNSQFKPDPRGLSIEEIAELACLDSRRTFLVILSQWHEINPAERTEMVERFEHCQKRTLDLTEDLRRQLSSTNAKKADTLRAYAGSMQRRLDALAAMKAGNLKEFVRILSGNNQS